MLLDRCGRVCGYPPGWDDISAGIWIDSLSDIPADLLALSVQRYIGKPGESRRWFPQPGQLRFEIIDELCWRRQTIRDADPRALPPPPEPEPSPIVREEIGRRLGDLIASLRMDAAAPRALPSRPCYVVDEVPQTIAGKPR